MKYSAGGSFFLPVLPVPHFVVRMSAPAPKRENILVNLVCNVALPTLILMKLSKAEYLGPKLALLTALAFPIGYGIYDFAARRTFNFLSVLGFAATLATGGLALLKLEPLWFAVKEAVVPSLIGLVVVVSHWAGRPLVRSMLFNEQVLNVGKIEAAIVERGQQKAFAGLLWQSSGLLAASFVLSAVLNFALARFIITAMPDTELFNEQLGRLTGWSWPVIVLPSMAMMMFALWRMLKGVERLTGLPMDDLFQAPPEKK
jgi:hypothetical protein